MNINGNSEPINNIDGSKPVDIKNNTDIQNIGNPKPVKVVEVSHIPPSQSGNSNPDENTNKNYDPVLAKKKRNKIIISIIILLIIIISIITIVYFLLRNKKDKAEEVKEKAKDLLISGKEKAEELLQDVGVIKEEKFWKKPIVISGIIGTVIIISLLLYFYFDNQENKV